MYHAPFGTPFGTPCWLWPLPLVNAGAASDIHTHTHTHTTNTTNTHTNTHTNALLGYYQYNNVACLQPSPKISTCIIWTEVTTTDGGIAEHSSIKSGWSQAGVVGGGDCHPLGYSTLVAAFNVQVLPCHHQTSPLKYHYISLFYRFYRRRRFYWLHRGMALNIGDQ